MKTPKYVALDTKVIEVLFLVTLRLVSRLELLASLGGIIRMQVFERFIVSLLTKHHILSLSTSSVILFCKFGGLGADINRHVSLANNWGVFSTALAKSLIHTRKKSGSREDPWGTPQFSPLRSNRNWFIETNCFLLVKYHQMHAPCHKYHSYVAYLIPYYMTQWPGIRPTSPPRGTRWKQHGYVG